jgi:hypothetical protein
MVVRLKNNLYVHGPKSRIINLINIDNFKNLLLVITWCNGNNVEGTFWYTKDCYIVVNYDY